MKKMKVLVYGWYYKGNIGDDFFIEAFRHLFPNFNLVFTDHIDVAHVKNVDAVFFGGGSFLYDAPLITHDALVILKTKKIFYIGVGIEPDIHPIHMELMSLAKLIATRSADQIERMKSLNQKVFFIPDLAYSLQSKVELAPDKTRSVLVLPNSCVLPQRDEPHWKHAAWAYFKSEFSQFLDWLVEEGYKINFFPLCLADKMDDIWAANELISHMGERSRALLLQDSAHKMSEVSKLISQYNVVITQRFHGIVLCEMTKTPYLAIHHHDKLKKSEETEGRFISYYGLSRRDLINAFELAFKMKYTDVLPLKSNIFETLSKEVTSLI
jgi:polysaccharide pyruvyl transferase WcaK-like protein